MPTARAATPSLPVSTAAIATPNPSPSPPIKAVAGTRTSSRKTSPVEAERKPSLFLKKLVRSPGVPRGIRKAQTPGGRRRGRGWRR